MQKSIQIGLAISHSLSYYRGVLRGIRSYAETHPNWLFTPVVPEEQPPKTLARLNLHALICSVDTTELAVALQSWRRPLVNIAAVIPDLRMPRVGVDNQAVGRLAAEHFLELGLRHFGFVGHRRWLFSMEREAGFRQAIVAAGHRVDCFHDTAGESFDPFVRHWPMEPRVQRWLKRLPKPVGIFAPNDFLGMQLSEACRQAHLRVPEDVALLGVDNDDLQCELARPTLSSVTLPTQEIGRKAGYLLERLLRGAKPPSRPVLLPPMGVEVRRSSEVLSFEDADLVAAVRFIRSQGHQPLCVADVLREVNVGRRVLERRFRLSLGRGIWSEIRRVHVEKAKRLLLGTNLPIKTVAIQSGFTDFRHLAVVFRQDLGMSPTTYRAEMRTPN